MYFKRQFFGHYGSIFHLGETPKEPKNNNYTMYIVYKKKKIF